MHTLVWIIVFGGIMSCIAFVGGLTVLLPPDAWNKAILPLVAFAAGSLIGGAMFHMIPAAVEAMGNVTALYCWVMGGFVIFYALEEFLHWHHSHTHSHSCGPMSPPHEHNVPLPPSCTDSKLSHEDSATHLCGLDREIPENNKEEGGIASTTPGAGDAHVLEQDHELTPDDVESAEDSHETSSDNREDVSASNSHSQQEEQAVVLIHRKTLIYLILVADAVHNFLGGMFVGASFVNSIELGISAWLAAAAHEVPQEFGDFAVLVHGGWSKPRALLFNFLSALTFPIGGVIAYAASTFIDVNFLVPFAAGNFLYIGGSDLIPEVKHLHGAKHNILHFASFSVGTAIMLGIRIAMKGW